MATKARHAPAAAPVAPAPTPEGHTRAIALVGFYRGEAIVQPGQILDLPDVEFNELRSFNQVDFAPRQGGR
jgi:hypothetical protein